ncbi:MAG: efflux RND transporter periplasmic adaptor subunit [Treponema sp.]|nr:efflux RND transporter periplasmic adaptor subunit [Treponema sp.]
MKNCKLNFKSGTLVLFLLIIISFSGCGQSGDKNRPKAAGAESERQVAVFAVNTTTAVKGHIQDYIALSGDIVAGSTVDTYSETAGKVAEVYVNVGQWVNRGQRVAAIDPSRPGMTFQWSFATAPISGTVTTLPAQVGMMVSPAVPLARISGGGGLEIKLFVAERFISKMTMNLPCVVTLDAWPGEVFLGRISELAPTVDPASRTMEIRVNVSDPQRKLKPGMFAKVRIVTERKEDVVKIPATALVSRFGENYVYVVVQDPDNPNYTIVQKRDIVPGILIDSVLEIRKGLEPDDEIVARGQTLLDDGVRVNVIERLAPVSSN